jgi:hypothetical protein
VEKATHTYRYHAEIGKDGSSTYVHCRGRVELSSISDYTDGIASVSVSVLVAFKKGTVYLSECGM